MTAPRTHAGQIGAERGKPGPDEHPLRAPDEPRQEIPADIIRAEPMEGPVGTRCQRLRQEERRGLFQGIGQRQQRCSDREHQPEQHDAEAHHPDARLPQQSERPHHPSEGRLSGRHGQCLVGHGEFLCQPDARIEEHIADLRDELRDYRQRHGDHCARLDDEDVVELRRLVEPPAEAVIGEHHFGDDDARQ